MLLKRASARHLAECYVGIKEMRKVIQDMVAAMYREKSDQLDKRIHTADAAKLLLL
jgi:hypothetical protein